MIRGDLSNRLVHLTKGATLEEAAATFMSILSQRKLRGGTGHIRGKFPCVCFSEAPLGVIAASIAAESGNRYAPFGVIVSKGWLFQRGGRPVIYQAHDEYDLLDETQKYRHVRYEPHLGTDHTWEREWRIRADELVLDLAEATFVVPTRSWVNQFHEQHADDSTFFNQGFSSILISPPPWHFVVLEDLGMEFPEIPPMVLSAPD